jgi:lactate dehydrogenase-like 2-hydroxyacid dehydrogenase
MKSKVLITRKIFDEVLSMVRQYFEVVENSSDAPFSPRVLIEKLQGKMGVITRRLTTLVMKFFTYAHSLKS